MSERECKNTIDAEMLELIKQVKEEKLEEQWNYERIIKSFKNTSKFISMNFVHTGIEYGGWFSKNKTVYTPFEFHFTEKRLSPYEYSLVGRLKDSDFFFMLFLEDGLQFVLPSSKDDSKRELYKIGEGLYFYKENQIDELHFKKHFIKTYLKYYDPDWLFKKYPQYD
jgi:hypothetical protein